MLWQRVWNRWKSFAPPKLVSSLNAMEQRLDLPGKVLNELVTLCLMVLRRQKIPDPSSISLGDKAEMRKSAEAISTSVYLFVVAIFCVGLVYSWNSLANSYAALLLLVAAAMAFSSHQVRDCIPVESKEYNLENKIYHESVVIKDRGMHANNLLRVSAILSLLAAGIQAVHFSIPASTLRTVSILLILAFLPYYFDLFMILSAVVGIVFFSIIVVCAMLLANVTFGPCAACVVFLILYLSYSLDVIIDPVIASVRSALRFLNTLSEI